MQITYLDGPRLKRALIAAGRRVQIYREQLNSINVFPVADSDTGTNMGSTLTAMTRGIIDSSDSSLAAVSRSAADYALSGARGNSGTILSQFFYGLTKGIEDRSRINTRAFSEIVRRAVDYTYEALSEPVEGTILTVLRVWSEKLVETSKKTADFAQLFTESLSYAKEALLDTRRRLPSLRKAKVVDAGALGFVYMIEGIVKFYRKWKDTRPRADTGHRDK
ncbi:MAG: DAK2 domain-containing protein [Spirochaetia bacterium]|nr:DAK2 domain-containing protein [Spirochaetia bacterium]